MWKWEKLLGALLGLRTKLSAQLLVSQGHTTLFPGDSRSQGGEGSAGEKEGERTRDYPPHKLLCPLKLNPHSILEAEGLCRRCLLKNAWVGLGFISYDTVQC